MRALAELPRILVPSIADEIGVSRARVRTEVRRDNWRRIAHGVVLTRPEEPTRADWADTGIALAGPSAALSGWDALHVRGLGERTPPSDEVLVLSQHVIGRVVGQVRIRYTKRSYPRTITPVDAEPHQLTPIVPIARAVADASLAYARIAPVRALVTSSIQRRGCTLPQLLAELDACPRQHSHALRLALADALDGARSVAEAKAARRMTSARVPAFELNVPFVDRTGRVLFVVDVLWRALRAVLEIDSREYHFSEKDWKATMRRHNTITRRGYALTHYPPSDVMGRDANWLDEVHGWLRGRARELGVGLPSGTGVIRPPASGPTPVLLP